MEKNTEKNIEKAVTEENWEDMDDYERHDLYRKAIVRC